MSDLNSQSWGWIVLFASTATLLCCALPILFVSLGLGAAVAATVSAMPFLVTLSLYKNWMFAGSLLLIGGAYWMQIRKARSCPTDPMLAARCERAKIWNVRLFGVASIIWGIGFFAAYFLEPLSERFGF